jgi:hypothetical protein
VLLAHEQPATSDGPGEPIEVVLGPVDLEEGFGASLVCSGPGDVTYDVDLPGSPGPEVTHCQDGVEWVVEAPGVTEPTVTLVVTADTATAWRLIVYDPPPGRYGRPVESSPAP